MKKILLILCILLTGFISEAQSVSFTSHSFEKGDLKYSYFSDENSVFALLDITDENSAKINVLDANFDIIHSFSINASMFANDAFLDYLDVEGAEPGMAYGVLVTQYLFNNDDLYEFIVSRENGMYAVYNEKGDFLGDCPGREIVIIKNRAYVQVVNYDDNNHFSLYTINKSDDSDTGNNGDIPWGGQDALLSIFGNKTYVLDLSYPYGANATIEIEPQAGWNIYSVIFNDKDVTDCLQGNKFVTDSLYGENTLEILMVESSGVSTIQLDSINRISINREANGIRVSNIEPTEILKVYDLNGTLIYIGTDNFIPLNQKGMYILKSEKGNIKFAF